MKRLFFLLLTCAAGLATGQTPERFAYGIMLKADGQDALYQLDLPAAVYRGVTRADLGDLRVFNGAGEVVPYAFLPRVTTTTTRPTPIHVRFFPLYTEADKGFENLSLQVERNAAGAIVKLTQTPSSGDAQKKLSGYLIDASEAKRPLWSLELEWNGDASYAGHARLEASDDLAHWKTVVSDAPLVSLEHGGARLEQRRIEFSAREYKYLRLSWTGIPAGLELIRLSAEPGEAHVEVARQWTTVDVRAGGKIGEYVFDTQGQFPVDRLRFSLPQSNTVVQVQLLSRARSDTPWRNVTNAVLYRLKKDGAEVTNPDVTVSETSARYWLLRVDQKGGGLGSGELTLELGWVPHKLVFAARGAVPFKLAYGSRGTKPSAYTIETLVPGYRADAKLLAKPASVAEGQVAAIKPADADKPEVLGGVDALAEKIDIKKWSLWGVLVFSVIVLGWIALRLLKQIDNGKRGAPSSTREPGEGESS